MPLPPLPNAEVNAPFDFSDADLFEALEGSDVPALAPEPSSELQVLGRRLSGQYVDLLAEFTQAAFSKRLKGPPSKSVVGALNALIRLNQASRVEDLVAQLTIIKALMLGGIPASQWGRTRFLNQLRRALLVLAELLEDADRDRLKQLLQYDRNAAPLLLALSHIRGIGPRRLERLYCAGLFTVTQLIDADPSDVSSVTSIPVQLAKEIIAESHAFFEEQKRKHVHQFHEQAFALIGMLPKLHPIQDAELLSTVKQTLSLLQTTLNVGDNT